ncbi:uncharacterized protein LOC128960963 [Oppia nitens]|uniref:uncharacterized protein LOC128960963 n=1 Tax=Oppia nitens TaxID=1686743 RepID=UPI0023DBC1D8|nr:uncharacterized protein LOC128960963 [Oppia nitens]
MKNSSDSQSRDDRNEKRQSGLNAPRKPSTESTISVTDQTSGKYTTTNSSQPEGADDSKTIISYGVDVHNTVAILMICRQHMTMALKQISPSKCGQWFPWAAVKKGQTWSDSYKELIAPIADDLKKLKACVDIKQRYQMYGSMAAIPQYNESVKLFVFEAEVKHVSETAKCFDTPVGYQWVPIQNVSNSCDVWGAEPSILADILANRSPIKENFYEISLKQIMRYTPKEIKGQTSQEELIKCVGVTEKDIIKLYEQYLQQCAPSNIMGFKAFIDYMTKLSLPGKSESSYTMDSWALFRSMARDKPYVTFNELLLGMCALDMNAIHGGKVGEIRASFLYFYYAITNCSKGLTDEEMIKLLFDIRLTENKTDSKGLDEELKKVYQLIGVESGGLKRQKFYKAVGEKIIRGTSKLYRSSISPLQEFRNKQVFESLSLKETPSLKQQEQVVGSCPKCRLKNYTLAVHTVRLSISGFIVEPQENRNQSDIKRMNKTLKKMSNQCFTDKTNANIILDSLREFSRLLFNFDRTGGGQNIGQNGGGMAATGRTGAGPTGDNTINWTNQKGRLKGLDKLTKLCEEAVTVFQRESRVIHVSSPVFVLGDIHGNLHDLMIYERSLWKMGPTCVASNFLFLGDYVDRGDYSIECITYLLCHKVLCPNKYFLLRGNHELRSVNSSFTFSKECVEKFGAIDGQKLWETFNKVFDFMPICAVIDDSIFCAHGGIPTSALRLHELSSIPIPLREPENESQIAWQILWNDPVTSQEFRDYQEVLRQHHGHSVNNFTGFLPNTKRGTAFYYSDEALDKFLSVNQLSHVIRAHEVIPNGYAFHMGGKCLTVFSSSKYCGGLNESAVVMVNDEKIRVIKIDTNY